MELSELTYKVFGQSWNKYNVCAIPSYLEKDVEAVKLLEPLKENTISIALCLKSTVTTTYSPFFHEELPCGTAW